MKNQLRLLLLLASLSAAPLLADDTNLTPIGDPASGFYIGQSSFPRGDSIEITSVEQLPDHVVVKGHYDLESAQDAELSFYITTRDPISVPTSPTQLKHIHQGRGDFELTHFHLVPGLMHVTMYSLSNGRGFAGVYFGNKADATEESQMNLGYYNQSAPAAGSNQNGQASSINRISRTGPNEALLEYLGNPVEPPADMDSRYTVPGLTDAIQLAARNAGITIKKLTIDDSEFPFLVGVICSGADVQKLKSEIKKLAGYRYSGSIGNDRNSDGSDTCNAFSIVPDRAYPDGTSQQIYHRLWLRQQVFYDRINQR